MKLLDRCPVCQSPAIRPYAMTYKPGFPHISRTICGQCSLVFANPMASIEELQEYYTNFYDKGNFGALKYKEKTRAKFSAIDLLDNAGLRKEASFVSRFKSEGKFLDVGFGLGERLYYAAKLGFEVYGTEFDPDCMDFLKNYLPNSTLALGDIFDAGFEDDSFDFVHCYHVIEHVLNPVEFLAELYRITKPGGIIYIGTPDLGGMAYRLYRLFNFMMFEIPKIVDGMEHTVIFNKRNLLGLLQSTGFKPIKHSSESVDDSARNIFLKSDFSIRKKILRFAQTKIKVNQVLIGVK